MASNTTYTGTQRKRESQALKLYQASGYMLEFVHVNALADYGLKEVQIHTIQPGRPLLFKLLSKTNFVFDNIAPTNQKFNS